MKINSTFFWSSAGWTKHLKRQGKQRIERIITFGHPLGVRYAGVVQVGVEHDDAEGEDERRVRVRENGGVLLFFSNAQKKKWQGGGQAGGQGRQAGKKAGKQPES